MSLNQGVENIQAVFQEVFDDKELKIFPEMTAKDVEEWDSFNHINLIIGLETVLGLTFTTDEIANMANVGDLVKILQQKGIEVSWD